jgi:cyclophilin family peptidyl-prolyl cis-trans isomerase
LLPTEPPTVTSVSVAASAPKYSQDEVVTVQGTHLDSDLSVTSTGCKNIARSTTTPYVSSATTAYYVCRTNAVGAQTVTVARASTGASLGNASFSVAMPQVTMQITNNAGVNGNVVIALAPDKTPITVDNFLYYVNTQFYDHTAFHRLDGTLGVLQGGGYAAPVAAVASAASAPSPKGTNSPIPLEVNKGLSNTQWTIAMARGAADNSATSQFFFNLKDNHATLDPSSTSSGYAVFGSVVSGTDVLQAAANLASDPNQCVATAMLQDASGNNTLGCLPVPNLVITSAQQTQ